ncbi:phosphate acyltransferase PlsX [Helicobacter mustelae]|uniref:phosphate acyltransferase PlsX n=1 Tax=Helicobacter mustelae TaxID=217 RepID=UPI0015673273|nr:phosphate acyltransferase PlsX [Helicobacter mustelae]
MKIAIDAMGADNGVYPIVEGVREALKNKDFFAYLVGDSEQISEALKQNKSSRIEIVHCQDFIRMEEQASAAAKRKESSIYVAMEMCKEKKADALISAGHSGATMSLATLRLGRINGVSRPAICTMMPTISERPSLVLDVGANTDCKPEFLVDFALMGYEYAKSVLGYPNPRVGLLSNGEEDTKGNELVKETFKILKDYDFFKGNVEGNDIFNASVDVVVCDGYTGNIALKVSEGVASSVSYLLKKEIKKSYFSMLMASLLKGAFSSLKQKMDYAEYGGAPLLGINGNVIISHGKSNARAIECAIYQAIRTIESDVSNKIQNAMKKRLS